VGSSGIHCEECLDEQFEGNRLSPSNISAI
jgi:hypothetical protein